MQTYVRGYVPDDTRAAIAQASPGTPIRFVASTEGVARDKMTIAADGWQLSNYRANPVFLFVHDYMGNRPPIGRAQSVKVDNGKLVAEVVFDQTDDFARQIESKYRNGFMNAVSVGWDTQEFEPTDQNQPWEGGKVLRAELLDISAVPVPGDPKALMERQKRALADFGRDLLAQLDPEPDTRDAQTRQVRGAIPYKKTPLADEAASWDGPGEVAKAEDGTELRTMCAWVDGEADPTAKQAYKLPHHEAGGDHACVWRGVAAAMARLMQGGMSIPDADRKGVYTHLSRHYQDFDKEPPEFRSADDLSALGPKEIRGLFLEHEPELLPHLFPSTDTRAGSVLSARNRDDLEQAASLISGVLARAKKEEQAGQTDTERSDADVLLTLFTGA